MFQLAKDDQIWLCEMTVNVPGEKGPEPHKCKVDLPRFSGQVTSFGEKNAPVRVVHHRARGATPVQRHVQRFERELGAKMARYRPSHHPAAEHVKHHRQDGLDPFWWTP